LSWHLSGSKWANTPQNGTGLKNKPAPPEPVLADAEGLKKLKQMLDKHEKILKLLQ
jgi:hypothetical protein